MDEQPDNSNEASEPAGDTAETPQVTDPVGSSPDIDTAAAYAAPVYVQQVEQPAPRRRLRSRPVLTAVAAGVVGLGAGAGVMALAGGDGGHDRDGGRMHLSDGNSQSDQNGVFGQNGQNGQNQNGRNGQNQNGQTGMNGRMGRQGQQQNQQGRQGGFQPPNGNGGMQGRSNGS